MSTTSSPVAPLDVSRTLRAGWALFKASFFGCMPLALLGVCAGATPQAVQVASSGAHDLLWWLAYLLGSLFMLACYGTIILRQYALRTGEDASVSRCLQRTLRRLPALVGNSLLALLMVALGLLLFVIPGLVISNYLWLAWPALLGEGKGPVTALTRSVQLVQGNFWRLGQVLTVAAFAVLVFVILAGVFAGVVMLGAQAGGAASLADAPSGPAGVSIGSVATVVLSLLLVPPVLYLSAIVVAAHVSLSAAANTRSGR